MDDTAALDRARNRFLDMIGDATLYRQDPDGDGSGDYSVAIDVPGASFDAFVASLGIRTQGRETLFEAVNRLIAER